MIPDFEIKPATEADVALILTFIKKLATYEKLAHKVVATENSLRDSLFGARRAAEVVIAYYQMEPIGFALFFHNYSTFLGQAGIYLEDLYVDEAQRGKGFGKALLVYLAKLAQARGCGRLEWSVLNWNEPAINFYRSLGAAPMDEWTVYRVSGAALEDLAKQ
jgi:GNAT superfamily N-acetyltransferase